MNWQHCGRGATRVAIHQSGRQTVDLSHVQRRRPAVVQGDRQPDRRSTALWQRDMIVFGLVIRRLAVQINRGEQGQTRALDVDLEHVHYRPGGFSVIEPYRSGSYYSYFVVRM